MILFLCPWSPNRFTGGYIYNREISRRVDSSVLRYILVGGPAGNSETKDVLNGSPVELLVADSLFFQDPAVLLDSVKITGAPYVLLVHYLPSADPAATAPRKESREKEELLIRKAHRIITTGERFSDYLVSRFPGILRPAVCAPGFSRAGGKTANAETGNTSMTSRKSGDVSLLTVANISPLKGIHTLVPVLASLADRSWTWTVYGDLDPDSDYIRGLTREIVQSGLSKRITFPGSIVPEKVPQALRDGDIFLFPSLKESWGMAAGEAAVAGLPVIANGVGEIPALLTHGREGYICPLREGKPDLERWFSALRLLMDNSEMRRRAASSAARKGALLPTWEESARRFMEILKPWTG